jgi:hypothetical protein
MAEVVKLEPVEVGAGYRFEAEKILDAAKSESFDRLAIVGELENGELYVAGTANAGETLILLEKAKRQLIFGDV